MQQFIDRPEVQLSEDWMIVVFLIVLSSIAYTRAWFPSRLKNMWRSIFNTTVLRQTIREESNVPKEYVLFQLNFFMISGMIVLLLMKFFSFDFFGWPSIAWYGLIVTGIALLYALKSLGLWFVIILINGDFTLLEYRYIVFLTHRVLGILLLPVAVMIAYLPKKDLPLLFFTAAGVFLLAYLYRVSKGLINALLSGVGVFYIFFYICTLEILPVIVGIKFFISQKPL
jgi:hypothetical protein